MPWIDGQSLSFLLPLHHDREAGTTLASPYTSPVTFYAKGGPMPKRKATQASAHKLIVSDAASPNVAIPLKAGMRFEIVSVTTVDDKLLPTKVGARLCGGSGTCLAIVDIAAERINPNPTKRG